jgi:ActR/RegA family two-component response regulator
MPDRHADANLRRFFAWRGWAQSPIVLSMSLLHTLMVIDDDRTLRLRMARAFADRGWAVATAADVEEAKRKALDGPPDYALVDLRLGDRSGLELISALKAISPSTTVVVLTGYGSIANAVEAVRLGATHYLSKPADADDVIAAFGRDGRLAPEPSKDPHLLSTLARTRLAPRE